jgi:polysaccharide biosynthesis/export protein
MNRLPRVSCKVCTFLIVCAFLSVSALRCGAQDLPPATQTTQPVAPSAAPSSTPNDPSRPTTNSTRIVAADSTLKLGVGDLVEMTVYNVPELTTKTRVTNDGELYVPLISHVHVAGLTIEEAQDLIEERMKEEQYLKDPHVALFVADYASEGASVLGEVAKPGIYPVLGQQRLLDLISIAGGLTEKAGHSIIVTRRSAPDKPLTLPFTQNLAEKPEENIPIYPGDTIFVRKADIAYVIGDVARPSGFLMDRGVLTVMQAVALAGGANRTAKLNGSRIVRKGPGGVTEISVKLKQILAAKIPDVELQPNDVLVIPASTGKILAGRSLEAAMQAATLVSVAAI